MTIDLNVFTPISVTLTPGGVDVIQGIEGVRTGTGNDVLTGNDFDNLFDSGLGDDTLTGGNGNDRLLAGGGNNSLNGGNGDDVLTSLGGADTLVGGAGNDGLSAGAGVDRLDGGDGDDFVAPGLGQDTGNGTVPITNAIDGGLGNDYIDLSDNNFSSAVHAHGRRRRGRPLRPRHGLRRGSSARSPLSASCAACGPSAAGLPGAAPVLLAGLRWAVDRGL